MAAWCGKYCWRRRSDLGQLKPSAGPRLVFGGIYQTSDRVQVQGTMLPLFACLAMPSQTCSTRPRRGFVVINKQNTPKAVLISFDDFRAFLRVRHRRIGLALSMGRGKRPRARQRSRVAMPGRIDEPRIPDESMSLWPRIAIQCLSDLHAVRTRSSRRLAERASGRART